MIRQTEINHLLYFRSLFNQYLVDMYAKIETERLNFIKNNQMQLRADNYIHLRDTIGRQDTDLTLRSISWSDGSASVIFYWLTTVYA